MHFLRWTTLATLLCFGSMSLAVTVDAATVSPIAKHPEKARTHDTPRPDAPDHSATRPAKRPDKKQDKDTRHTKSKRQDKDKNTHKNKSSDKSKHKDKRRSADTRKSKADRPREQSSRPEWMERASHNTQLLGKASWYGSDFHGGPTASGIPYDMHAYTAAHRTLPMGTVVEVTEENSGRSVVVCISDRGPFTPGRVIDLSYAAATDLGIKDKGVAPVNLRVVSDTEGNSLNDEAFYVRLLNKTTSREELVGPFRQFADATVMKEVLHTQYPDAAVVLGPDLANN